VLGITSVERHPHAQLANLRPRPGTEHALHLQRCMKRLALVECGEHSVTCVLNQAPAVLGETGHHDIIMTREDAGHDITEALPELRAAFDVCEQESGPCFTVLQ
jgi:hypothetical protein